MSKRSQITRSAGSKPLNHGRVILPYDFVILEERNGRSNLRGSCGFGSYNKQIKLVFCGCGVLVEYDSKYSDD